MNNMILTAIKPAKNILIKSGLKVKRYSPQLCLGIGSAMIVGGIILACKETLKVEEILDEAEYYKAKIKEAHEAEIEDYTETDYKKDTVINYVHCAGRLVKNYAPAAACTVSGFGLIFVGFGILNKRYADTIAMYNALDIAYKKYRERVKAEVGEEKEFEIYRDLKKLKIDSVKEVDGKKVKSKEEVYSYGEDPTNVSPYAKFFDPFNSDLASKNDPEYNMTFLLAQQNYANDLLKSRGHLFLNEVYDMLGIKRTRAGAQVGWIDGGDGDNYVDFGLFRNSERVRAFVNGNEAAILLDFNVDGIISDKI